MLILLFRQNPSSKACWQVRAEGAPVSPRPWPRPRPSSRTTTWSWGCTAGFVIAQMEVLKSKLKDLLKTLQNCGPGANRDHPEVRCYASNPHNFRSPAMTGSKCVVDPSLKRT